MTAATVPLTGEVIELPNGSPEDIVNSLRLAGEYLQAYEKIKKALQTQAREIVDDKGQFEHDGYLLRVFSTQRRNYDKSVLRDVLDADLYDLMLEPVKGRIDDYIADNVYELGDVCRRLRETMVPVGNPYTTCRLERLDREAA